MDVEIIGNVAVYVVNVVTKEAVTAYVLTCSGLGSCQWEISFTISSPSVAPISAVSQSGNKFYLYLPGNGTVLVSDDGMSWSFSTKANCGEDGQLLSANGWVYLYCYLTEQTFRSNVSVFKIQ